MSDTKAIQGKSFYEGCATYEENDGVNNIVADWYEGVPPMDWAEVERERKDMAERDAKREPGLYFVQTHWTYGNWTVRQWHQTGSSREGNWTMPGGSSGYSCQGSGNFLAIDENRIIPPPSTPHPYRAILDAK